MFVKRFQNVSKYGPKPSQTSKMKPSTSEIEFTNPETLLGASQVASESVRDGEFAILSPILRSKDLKSLS